MLSNKDPGGYWAALVIGCVGVLMLLLVIQPEYLKKLGVVDFFAARIACGVAAGLLIVGAISVVATSLVIRHRNKRQTSLEA